MFLAVDYGQKKLGLAVSDETMVVSSPIDMVRVKSDMEAVNAIKREIEKRNINEIVVGVPSGWQNVDSPQTKTVRDFIELLKSNITLPIHEWDESYSTKIAEKNLHGKQRKNSDSYAAAHILQEYIDYIKYEKNI